MSDLTARLRTCAAALLMQDVEHKQRALEHAADLLIEAADLLEAAPMLYSEPMEVIPPVEPGRMMAGTWVATADTLPVANPFRSDRTCPKCDSRAAKRVHMWKNTISLICPACDHAWPYTKKPPAEGTAGGKG